jgi:hypothetical protein
MELSNHPFKLIDARSSYPHHKTNGILKHIRPTNSRKIQERVLRFRTFVLNPKPTKFDQNHAKKQLSRVNQNKNTINSIISDITSEAATRILNLAENKALAELKDNDSIVISLADKGDTWVIMNKEGLKYMNAKRQTRGQFSLPPHFKNSQRTSSRQITTKCTTTNAQGQVHH